MSKGKFEISTDVPRRLLMIKMSGLWEVATVEAYREAVIAAGERLIASGCKADQILALVDVREGGPQSQEVVAAYRERVEAHGLAAPKRLATVVASALLKRQIERIGVSNQRVFTDERAALDWLLAGEANC